MEYEDDHQDLEEGSLLDRIKESPRTVSALIIILIVAAAIYAFSGDGQPTPEEIGLLDNEQVTEESKDKEEAMDDSEESDDGQSASATSAPTTTPKPVPQEKLMEQRDALPEASRTSDAFVEVAARGDGVTHLARRAATRYLTERQDISLSNEHRVYIEDYVKDHVGSQGLAVGESVTVPFSVMEEAVTRAQTLTPTQLQNLSQYTSSLG